MNKLLHTCIDNCYCMLCRRNLKRCHLFTKMNKCKSVTCFRKCQVTTKLSHVIARAHHVTTRKQSVDGGHMIFSNIVFVRRTDILLNSLSLVWNTLIAMNGTTNDNGDNLVCRGGVSCWYI